MTTRSSGVDYAFEQYSTLDATARVELDGHIAHLAQDPTALASYDSLTNQWSSSFAGGHGIALSLISSHHHRIAGLRIIYLS